MKLIKKVIVAMLLFIAISCQYDPYADKSTTSPPAINNIAGTYILERQTVDRTLPDDRFKAAVITFNPDSTFKASNLPEFSRAVRLKYHGLVSAEGKWHTAIIGTIASYSSSATKSHWGIQLTALPQNLRYIGLMGDRPPYKLIITFGDPDAGEVMIFRKK
jgi:hypothetical protein